MNRVIVFGASELALAAQYYLTHDSPYEVAAFAADGNEVREDMFGGRPLVAFEDVDRQFPPGQFGMLVCVPDGRVDGPGPAAYRAAKAKGYELIRYVSSRAITWPGLVVGDNCLVLEGSVIQPACQIGNDVVIGSGAIIGHHSVIGDHCRLAPNAVVLGCVNVGPHCALGANSTIRDGVTVARECIVGAGVVITNSTRPKETYAAARPGLLPMTSEEFSPLLTWPVR